MTPRQNINRYSRTIVSFTAVVFVASLWCVSLAGDAVTNVVTATDVAERVELEAPDPNQPADYSKFRHGNQYHSRLPCLVCHVRNDNSTRIGFPGRNNHLPSAGCHGLQFSDPASPICTICHTNSQTGTIKGFPGLQSFRRKIQSFSPRPCKFRDLSYARGSRSCSRYTVRPLRSYDLLSMSYRRTHRMPWHRAARVIRPAVLCVCLNRLEHFE